MRATTYHMEEKSLLNGLLQRYLNTAIIGDISRIQYRGSKFCKYCIAPNFRGANFSWIGCLKHFAGINFVDQRIPNSHTHLLLDCFL